MNRSFRAPDRGMQRQQMGSLRSSVIKEKEDELALFLEMRKREKERNNMFLHNSEDFDAPLGSAAGNAPTFHIASAPSVRKSAAEEFLNSDNDKNDYDWLLTPPGTPLFPSLEMESQRTMMNQIGTPKARPTALKSRLANAQPEPAARVSLTSRQQTQSSNTITRRPSSSSGPGSRPSTPTGRPTLTAPSKLTLTSCSSSSVLSRPKSSPITSSITSSSSSKPSRSSTPTRSTLPATKPAARSSTPTSRSTAPRSSTPTGRSVPIAAAAPKPSSRASTPTRRPTVTPAPVPARNPAPPPRASSPTVKPRPWKPSEMPGFSLEAPPNLRTSLSDRPTSATRGRPGAPSLRSSSVEPAPTGRVRRQSCSPSRGRPPVGGGSVGGSVPAMNRAYAKANDNTSPGVYGAKMVERVINMRKLVPPKQDDNKHSPRSNLSGKSTSSPDSSGFGRTLSKKSLDMAIRHMDIRRSIPGNLRPLMTNIPASSMYSVRSGPTRSRAVSMSDSPLATTSSNASSDVSVNNNALCFEAEDDISSIDKPVRSPASVRGR